MGTDNSPIIDADKRLESQLIRDEDEVLHVYRDHLGYLTIGVGILVDQRKGGGITQAESRYLLANRLAICKADLLKALPWTASLDKVRFAALVNMRFQLGLDGLLQFKRMLTSIRDGRLVEAEAHALDSKWAREDTPERARRVARQLATGEWQ